LARDAIRAHNAKRGALPKCGAIAKHSGERCRQLAMANGKCHWHGGATPRGNRWHKRQPPNPGPDHVRKVRRKLSDVDRAARNKAARLAKMTAAEREAHKAWQRTHKPGSAVTRAAERRRRTTDPDLAHLLAPIERPETDELRALDERRQELLAEIAAADRPVSIFD
jgi:hypothetical protein